MIVQVLITDGLPLTVCIDCCVLLNQCNKFIEKTNQAQVLLRHLLIDPKSEPQPIEPNIDYVEETVEFPKQCTEDNNREEIVECQLSGNYINQTVNITNASYFLDGSKDENSEKCEAQEMQDNNTKQKKSKVQMKKSSPIKQTKKKLKKKNQIQKMQEPELDISSKMEKEGQNDVKNNMKIVDNYISGKNLKIHLNALIYH